MLVDGAVLDSIVRHAREAAPNECCGLLIGTEDAIEEAVPTRNARESPSTYQVDPADHFALIRRARAEQRQIIGAYHSHTRSAAEPSPRDIAESHDESLVHLIVSLAAPEPRVAAFRIRKAAAEAEAVALNIRRSAGC
jgi:proteasome lid subunit RPN8/RPN11